MLAASPGSPLAVPGLHALGTSDVLVRPLSPSELAAAAGGVAVSWTTSTSPSEASRKRARSARLDLEVANGDTAVVGSLSVSLPASMAPRRVAGGDAYTVGELVRAALPRDATPNLPSLGAAVRFVTLATAVPPGCCLTVCTASGDADDSARHPGFVYSAGLERPHPHPTRWEGSGLVLQSFPLAADSAFLCTQGFGGRGHHRGLASHHAAEFECAVGTQVLAA